MFVDENKTFDKFEGEDIFKTRKKILAREKISLPIKIVMFS